MNEIKYKQYVIVPRRPKMSKGKIASQVAHATFMALEKQRGISDNFSEMREDGTYCEQVWPGEELIKMWKESGMCVIVLECKSQVELMNIAKYCEQWSIDRHLYIDEGLTEIPMGTATAFATGVLTEDQFWMFSQLPLFGESKWQKFKRKYNWVWS